MGASARAHPVTLNGTGNTTGPMRYYYCQPCNTRKPGTKFRVYPTGRRGKLCRECRAEQVKAWKRATSYTGSDPNTRPRRANAPEIRMPPDHLELNGDAARAVLDGQAEWGPLAEDRVRLLEDGIEHLKGGWR